MQIDEKFTVEAPVEAVWRFCEDVDRVARCVPGVRSVTPIGSDRYRIVAAQKVGFITATFELVTQLERKESPLFIEFTSAGKGVGGTVADLRSRNRVEFEALADGGTRVRMILDVMVGGMLGALGHKVIVAKSRELAEGFARALRAALQSHAAPGPLSRPGGDSLPPETP